MENLTSKIKYIVKWDFNYTQNNIKSHDCEKRRAQKQNIRYALEINKASLKPSYVKTVISKLHNNTNQKFTIDAYIHTHTQIIQRQHSV